MALPNRADQPAGLTAVVCALLAVVFAGYVDFVRLREDELTDKRDIRALYDEGGRLLRGENPYARVLGDTTGVNRKYATYFPVFYIMSAGSQTLLKTYPQFISFWRVVFFLFYVAIGATLAACFFQRRWWTLGLAALLLWMFNRWTLKSVQLMHIDFMPILLLLLSLLLLNHSRRTALLLLGLSLAIKQVAIFLVPLYLVWIWNQSDSRTRLRDTVTAATWIALIPVLVSLPFIVWGPKAFVKSILFSAVRADDFQTPAQTIDDVLDWRRSLGKLPMLVLMALVYAAALQQQIRRFTAALLVLAVFVGFNTIWFRQYEVWPMALLPLIALDVEDWLHKRTSPAPG